MLNGKMSAEDMTRYYVRVHEQTLARDRDDALAAVIAPDKGIWFNRFIDFAHRLGMKKAFKSLESEWGSLRDRSVLDLGCGRGRWCKEYAGRGASVTGVDISPEAIRVISEEMPEHRFIPEDIAAVTFRDESFDVVNSVTVLQHMPHWKQSVVLSSAAAWLKPGGYLILLENILGFDAPHVFPHRTWEWIALAEETGLKCTDCWGSNFQVLFRVYASLSRFLRGPGGSGEAGIPSVAGGKPPSVKYRLECAAGAALAIASFPAEWVCRTMPLVEPSHIVMMLRKRS